MKWLVYMLPVLFLIFIIGMISVVLVCISSINLMVTTLVASNSTNDNDDEIFANLYPAIVECFVIILLGYIAGRTNLISVMESKGIGLFVSDFALPALVLKSMIELDFKTVNWTFLSCILISKSILFVTVALLTLLVGRPINFGNAGLFAIFTTQSNDFALGYPIVKALYEKTHPDYLNYIYLVAPISLIILNPIGFVLMDVQKKRSIETNQDGCFRRVFSIFRNVFFNPIVLMTIVGIICNFIFSHKVPNIFNGLLGEMGRAFNATALFYLGMKMVGKLKTFSGFTLVIPALLITAKTLILPLLTREIVSVMNAGNGVNDTIDLSNFGFLFGTFPTAPGVFVYATQFNLGVDLIATSMVACTFLSAPLMFISAKMLTLSVTTEMDEYHPMLLEAAFDISIIAIISAFWVILIFILSQRWRRVPHCLTICLLLSQALACFGILLWNVTKSYVWVRYIQFVIFLLGVYGSRCWTAALALAICVMRVRSLCFLLRLKAYIYFIGGFLPVLFVSILLVLSGTRPPEDMDPTFQYGLSQMLLSAFVLVVCFCITVTAIIIMHRYERRYSEYNAIIQDDDTDEEHRENDTRPLTRVAPSDEEKSYQSISSDLPPKSFPDIEDLAATIGEDKPEADLSLLSFNMPDALCRLTVGCSQEQRKTCASTVRKYHATNCVNIGEDEEILLDYSDHHQISRHVVYLLLLCISMLIGIFLCLWRLFYDSKSGIYVEIEFLDTILNFGQAFLAFAVFGLDTQLIIIPFKKRWRRFWYGVDYFTLPLKEDLDPEILQTCNQFEAHHLNRCIADLARDRRYRLKSYKAVFCGSELVDWLLCQGLAHDRRDAVRYGRHLLLGRVLHHIHQQHNFHDLPYFYTFRDLDSQS